VFAASENFVENNDESRADAESSDGNTADKSEDTFETLGRLVRKKVILLVSYDVIVWLFTGVLRDHLILAVLASVSGTLMPHIF
jgi:hypothetical protein